jgi:hypothetical protein
MPPGPCLKEYDHCYGPINNIIEHIKEHIFWNYVVLLSYCWQSIFIIRKKYKFGHIHSVCNNLLYINIH